MSLLPTSVAGMYLAQAEAKAEKPCLPGVQANGVGKQKTGAVGN